jgi:hypothetical protein
MSCLRKGTGRAEFIRDIESAVAEQDRSWSNLNEDPTPDKRWEMLVSTVAGVAKKHFSRARVDTKIETERRKELLHLRTELKSRQFLLLEGVDSQPDVHGELERLQWELMRLNRRIKRIHREENEARRQEIVEELSESWESRELSETQRLSRLLGGRLRGPKKRWANAVRHCLPCAEWLSFFCSGRRWREGWGRSGFFCGEGRDASPDCFAIAELVDRDGWGSSGATGARSAIPAAGREAQIQPLMECAT